MGVQYPTHVGRVLGELEITSICANSPQAKGRIERAFGVLQDRMIGEMRLDGIIDIESANRWLEQVFIDRHNARFAKKGAKGGSAFRKISKQEIYHHVCFAYEATVGNDNCIRLGGMIIDIPKGKNGAGYAKKRALVKQHLDGAWTVWLGDKKIASHKATGFKEPIRSWKQRNKKKDARARQATQVYISSKPAPPPKGHFPVAVRGTY